MFREWLREQWEDIRYAHKSVWVSMIFFVLIGYYAIWYAIDYKYSRQITERDAIIERLNAEKTMLQQEVDKIRPKSSAKDQKNGMGNSDDGSIADMKERAQEKITTINNDVSNGYDRVKQKAHNLR